MEHPMPASEKGRSNGCCTLVVMTQEQRSKPSALGFCFGGAELSRLKQK